MKKLKLAQQRKSLHEKQREKKFILNNKNIPAKVPGKKGDKTNCLDLSIVIPNLKTYLKKFTVDSKR